MNLYPGRPRRRLAAILAPIVIPLIVVVAGAAIAANAQASPQPARWTNMTTVEMPSSPAALQLLAALAVVPQSGQSAAYMQADLDDEQIHALNISGLTYHKQESYLLVHGIGLAAEAFVTGNNGTNMPIQGNGAFYSNINIQGAPLGKTVTKVDLGITLNYPNMCNIYLNVFHPSMAIWYQPWNGANSDPSCPSNLNRTWNGIHTFDHADINGTWKLQVQETAGLSTGYLDYWSLKIYYQDASTPTPTRTPGSSYSHRVFLPIIIQQQ